MSGIRVVIPTFNHAHYLPQAIESVLAQTCGPVEIIVGGDGSTDDTRDVVTGHGDRVRYINTLNGGAGRDRNVDSDDLVYP